MKYYAYIENGRVKEIIPEYTEFFKNIPIEKRYTKEFINKCVVCDKTVKQGMDYNSKTGEFTNHLLNESVEEVEENEGEQIE